MTSLEWARPPPSEGGVGDEREDAGRARLRHARPLTPGTHQQAVEEFVHEEPHGADEQVQQVVEELDVQHHGPVAPGERPAVAHEAHEEDDFIADLGTRGTVT